MPVPAPIHDRLRRRPLISPRQWLRSVVFWSGAVLMAAVAIGFAALANRASDLFVVFQAPRPWVAFIVCPAGLVAPFLLTRHVFPGAQAATRGGANGKPDHKLPSCLHLSCGTASRAAQADEHDRESENGP